MKKLKSNKQKVFLNTFFITFGSIIEKVVFFFITVLIARYLSVEHYGEYSTALGFATFFAMFANLNINISIIRAISLKKEYENEYFTASILIKIILSIAVGIALIISIYFTGYSKDLILLTLIFGLVRICSEFIYSSYAFYEAREKFHISALFLTAFSSLFLIGTIIVIMLKGNYFHLVSVRLFITIFFLAVIFIFLKKTYKIKFNAGITKDFIKGMLPFSGSFAVSNITANCGIVLLPLLQGTVYAGIYQNAYIIFASLTFVHANLLRVLVPFLYKYPYKENKDKFQFTFDVYSKIFGITSFYLLLIFFMFSPNIIPLIFGQKYNNSIPVFKIFSFALPLVSIAPTIIITIYKQKVNTRIDTIAAIFNISMSYVLIYHFKAEGAAAALVFTSLIVYCLSHGYLIINKYIIFSKALILNLKLLLISAIVYLVHDYYMGDFHYITSILLCSSIFAALIVILVLKKDDIRILKEMAGKN